MLIVKNTFYEYIHSEHRLYAQTKSQPVFSRIHAEISNNQSIGDQKSLKLLNVNNYNDIVTGDTLLASPEVETVEMTKVEKIDRFSNKYRNRERLCRLAQVA
jgi:hypothetical protein